MSDLQELTHELIHDAAFKKENGRSKRAATAVPLSHRLRFRCHFPFPQQSLYFFPEPQGQGSFLPIFLEVRR